MNGFPTVIIMNTSGKVLNRAEGYSPDSGPSAYLPQLGAPAAKKPRTATPPKK